MSLGILGPHKTGKYATEGRGGSERQRATYHVAASEKMPAASLTPLGPERKGRGRGRGVAGASQRGGFLCSGAPRSFLLVGTERPLKDAGAEASGTVNKSSVTGARR